MKISTKNTRVGMRAKQVVIVSMTLLFLFSALASWAGGQAETEEVERLVIGFPPPAVETNRIWAGSWVIHGQFEPMLETLIGNDPETGEHIPRLARRWEASSDFRTWTFYLREGIPFHFDYGELTAEDVKHTYDLLARSDSQVNMASVWRNAITNVEIVDDYTIAFHFAEPYVDGERLFSRTGGEMYITSKAQWDQEGVAGVDRRVVGTGVYRFKERTEGQNLVVEAVEDHWRDKASFPEIEMRWIPDETTRLAQLISREIHAAELGRDVAASAVGQGMEVIPSRLENMQRFVPFGGLYLNSGPPATQEDNPLLDRRVRQALIKAVNLEELQNELYHGRVTPTYRPGWVPSHEGWNPEWEKRFDDLYGYDPDRARELLREAGYEPGEIEVRINYYEHPGQPESPDVLESLQPYWEAIGVNAIVTPVDFGSFLSRWFEDTGVHGEVWITRNTPLRTTQEFISFWHTAASNGRLYLHDFIEERFAELVHAVDPQERDRIAREVGNHLFDEFVLIPLGGTHVEIVVNPDVIADWAWPGQAPTNFTHYYAIEPVR
jgi:peptide/nickel transport system substrate-binding protein